MLDLERKDANAHRTVRIRCMCNRLKLLKYSIMQLRKTEIEFRSAVSQFKSLECERRQPALLTVELPCFEMAVLPGGLRISY